MTDEALAVARLTSQLDTPPDPATVLVFVYPGVPVVKERARWSPKNARWYTPSKTEQAEEALAWAFRAAMGRRRMYRDTVAMIAFFYVPTRRRRDVDNLMKLVMDAATKASVWKDDSQVVTQIAHLVLEPAQPRTVVALAPCLSSLSSAPLLTATGAQ